MAFAINKKLSPVTQLVVAVIIYIAFAGWLMGPHLDKFAGVQKILLLTPIISATGAYMLARRYVNSFVASFLGGIIYGFGSFTVAFYCFHPFAFCVYAALPWTFIPAVFLYKLPRFSSNTANLLAAVLSLVPFLFVFAVFWLAAKFYLYPIPPETIVSSNSFAAIITPLLSSADVFSLGFYHASFGALLVGLVLFFKTRRFWTAVLLILAVLLAFYNPLLNVPPVFWLSFIALICSLIIAEGFEAMTLAGKTDANWLLLAAAALILQAGVTYALHRPIDYQLSSALSAVSVIAVLFVFFIARAGLAMHYLRMAVLYISALVDILIVTREMITKVLS
ncbi:MAG: hypothetical protein ABSE89_06075 [Sedimentisphaerales bacterium]